MNLKDKQEDYLEKKHMATILASIGDGVVSTDTHGIIDFMNKAGEVLTGYKSEEAIGNHINEIIHLIDITTNEPIESLVELALQTKGSVGLKKRSVIVSKNGKRNYLSASCSPIKDSEEIISGVVMVFRNITRIIQMEEKLLKQIF